MRTAQHPPAQRTLASALSACALFTAAAMSAPSVQAQEPARYPTGVAFRGINRAGLEYGIGWDGWYRNDTPPESFDDPQGDQLTKELEHYQVKGFNVVRLPIAWERLQHELNGPLTDSYVQSIVRYVTAAQALRIAVIIDLHNYASYSINAYLPDGQVNPNSELHRLGDGTLTFDHLANVWTQLLTVPALKENPDVFLGLMNEPHQRGPNPNNPAEITDIPMLSPDWFEGIQTVINAIRETGSRQLILVPNTFGSDADHWNNPWWKTGDSTDAVAARLISDSANNIAFDIHSYFNPHEGPDDKGHTRTYAEYVKDVTDWAHGSNGPDKPTSPPQRLFLSELGYDAKAGDGSAAIASLLDDLGKNADVWLGWTPWDLKSGDTPDSPDFRLTNDETDQNTLWRHTKDLAAMKWYDSYLKPDDLKGGSMPTPPPSGGGSGDIESVYGDALATGWVDWSYNLAKSEEVTDPARGSHAYLVKFGEFSGFKLAHATDGDEHPLDASAYSAVVLHLRPTEASVALGTLSFQFENGSDSVLISKYATLAVGEWTEVRIPLAAANSSGKPIVTLELNDASGSTIAIDDIGLERVSPLRAPDSHKR